MTPMDNRQTVYINYKRLMVFILSLVVVIINIRIPFLSHSTSIIPPLYFYSELFVLVVLLFLNLFLYRSFKLNKLFVLIILYYLSLYISCIINKNDISSVSAFFITVFSLLLLMNITWKKYYQQFISAMVFFLVFITVANTVVALLLYPNALYLNSTGRPVCFLLGEDNASINMYLLAFGACTVKAYMNKRTFDVDLLLSAVNLAVFSAIRDSAGGIACSAILIILLVISFTTRITIKAKWLMVSMAVALVVFVILQQFRIFERFIALYLHRNDTLSGRTLLWSSAVKMIKEKPLIGYGAFSSQNLGYAIQSNATLTPHNTYLANLIAGGAISFSFFSAILLRLAKSVDERASTRDSGLLVIGLSIPLIHAQIEGSDSMTILLQVILLYYLLIGEANGYNLSRITNNGYEPREGKNERISNRRGRLHW